MSHLRLTYTQWAFLLAFWNFGSPLATATTCAFMVPVILLIAWPLFALRFLLKNKDRIAASKDGLCAQPGTGAGSKEQQDRRRQSQALLDNRFDQRHGTLYQGISTDRRAALIYNVIFCARRFDIVFINIVFSAGSPLTNFSHHHYFAKIVLLLWVQTAYLVYIWSTRPHVEPLFNRLELFNELAIVLLCYVMTSYSGIVPRIDTNVMP